jgi:hypothetical protein
MTIEIEQAIVRIQTQEGRIFGTGFLVCCNQVLSCAHVVADSIGIPRDTQEMPTSLVYLDFPLLSNKSEMLSSLVKYWDPTADIALMELLEEKPKSATPIELEEIDDYSRGEFSVCGFPRDEGDWVLGVMLGRIEPGFIQIEAETAHRIRSGFSGGPVWHHTYKKLAGMIVASDETTPEDKTAYIIPATLLLAALPHLRKNSKAPSPFRYACFISFPTDNNLIRDAAEEIQKDLNNEITAQLRNKGVLARPDRDPNNPLLAKELCESACMVMVYTFRYFDKNDPLCAREYRAMEILEEARLAELKLSQSKECSLIIPIVLRGKDKFPDQINIKRPVYDFTKYFILSKSERRKRHAYRQDIVNIANYIVTHCMKMEQHMANPCGNCNDFKLPRVNDVTQLLTDWSPRYVL